MINQKVLGKSNIKVSSIGFGGAPIADLYEILEENLCFETIKKSHKSSIFDLTL